MNLEKEVEGLKSSHQKLSKSHEALKTHVETKVDKALIALRSDMTEIRSKLGNVATTDHILSLSTLVNQSNANMAAALNSVPADQANKFNYAMLALTGIMAIAMVVSAIAVFGHH